MNQGFALFVGYVGSVFIYLDKNIIVVIRYYNRNIGACLKIVHVEPPRFKTAANIANIANKLARAVCRLVFCWQCWLSVFNSQHCQQTDGRAAMLAPGACRLAWAHAGVGLRWHSQHCQRPTAARAS
jgi:hypothetical protein